MYTGRREHYMAMGQVNPCRFEKNLRNTVTYGGSPIDTRLYKYLMSTAVVSVPDPTARITSSITRVILEAIRSGVGLGLGLRLSRSGSAAQNCAVSMFVQKTSLLPYSNLVIIAGVFSTTGREPHQPWPGSVPVLPVSVPVLFQLPPDPASALSS